MAKCEEWLDVFYKGTMIAINSKGEIRNVTKQTEDSSQRNMRQSSPYKRKDRKKKGQSKDAKKKQGFARNIK